MQPSAVAQGGRTCKGKILNETVGNAVGFDWCWGLFFVNLFFNSVHLTTRRQLQ